RRCGRKAILQSGACRLPRPQSRRYGIPHLRASIETGLATATEGIPTMQRIHRTSGSKNPPAPTPVAGSSTTEAFLEFLRLFSPMEDFARAIQTQPPQPM